MALTDGDKAECKEIARVIIKEVLEQHILACPWGRKLIVGKARFIGVVVGVAIGSGVASGGTIALLLKAVL